MSAPATGAAPGVPAVLGYRELLAALQEAGRQAPDQYALLFVELPDFQRTQAQLGFQACSVLLAAMTERISQALHERASIWRCGDGSFCVLVRAIRNRGHAVLAAEKLLQASEEVVAAAGIGRKVLLHVGIALHPLHAADTETLLRSAQLAAAAAHARELRLQVFDADSAGKVVESWHLAGEFAAALQAGELQVHYQPKLRVADGRPGGVEALMRWQRDGRAVATPDAFIPLAEAGGLIRDVTWYALSNALQVSARCGGLPVAVNITPGMLHHREFVDMIDTAVTTWNVAPQCLTVEVTEGALIADFEQATSRLSKVRDRGVRVSIDDFGTGYASLSYFKRIPADELKIDKSFVLQLLEDDADRRLVSTIITLAHQFRLDVVAEGVETPAVLELLARLGCDYAQGFLIGRALAVPELDDWLARHGLRVADGQPAAPVKSASDP